MQDTLYLRPYPLSNEPIKSDSSESARFLARSALLFIRGWTVTVLKKKKFPSPVHNLIDWNRDGIGLIRQCDQRWAVSDLGVIGLCQPYPLLISLTVLQNSAEQLALHSYPHFLT